MNKKPKPKHSFKGSIYKPACCNRLYINYKGKKHATELLADAYGYKKATEMLEQLFLLDKGLIKEDNIVLIADAWQEYLATLVNKSAKTIVGYKEAYNKIFASNEENYLTISNVEAAIINFLKTTALAKISINIHLTAAQIFLNYCYYRKWIDRIPLKKKYSFKIQRKDAKTYNGDECDLIINYFKKNSPEIANIIIFMLETGARDVDALTLEWSQIDLEKNDITWKNKITKFDERRPISTVAARVLIEQQRISTKKVFTYSYNSATTLAKRLNKAMRECSIIKDGRSLQEFRVTFRMRLAKRGMDEKKIEWLLRHSSGEIIYKYYTNYAEFEAEIRQTLG